MWWFILWAAVNITGGILFIFDKRRAVNRGRRVPEKTLILWAAVGAAPAMWAAGEIVNHKTRVMKFKIVLPLFTLLQAGAVFYLLWLLDMINI